MSPSSSIASRVDWDLGGLLEHASKERAETTALIHEDQCYSFQWLKRTIEEYERTLEELGVGPGDTLALWQVTPLTRFLTLHTGLHLGCRWMPLNPHLPPSLLPNLLGYSGAKWLVTAVPPPMAIAGIQLVAEDRFGVRSPFSAPLSRRPLPLENTRWLMTTSGTTGEPKLAKLSGHNLLASARASRQRLGLIPGDCWLCCLPLFHVGGASIALRCLEAGATMALLDRFDAEAVWRMLDCRRITHLSLVPLMLRRLLDQAPNRRAPEHLKVVLLGGEAANGDMAQQALDQDWPLCPTYGMTETATQVASLYPPPERWYSGLAGQPLEHIELHIGDRGRILLRGPGVMKGYAGATPREPHEWFQTGDCGRLDEEGNLWIEGRLDEVFISGGEKVHPGLVENELSRCPGIQEAGVIAIDDDSWGVRLVAIYRGNIPADELENWCRQNLNHVFKPRNFLRIHQPLPTMENGKPDRKALTTLATNHIWDIC